MKTETNGNATARILLPAMLMLFILAFSSRAFPATPAGTEITHSRAAANSPGFSGNTIYSNTLATTTVAPIYGFASNPFQQSLIPVSISQGQASTYTFGITNNGNTTDGVNVVISSFDDRGLYPGVTWQVEVDDAAPFVEGLIWQNSGNSNASAGGDRATAGVSLPPGGSAQFSLRVNAIGAPYGATMSFSVTLETTGDAPSYPGGAYTGFNSTAYAGPASVSSAGFGPTVPPSLMIASPADGTQTSSGTITIMGTTERGAAGSIRITGAQQGQQNMIYFTPDTLGSFSTLVNLYPGLNSVTAFAQDWQGNTASQTIAVTSYQDAPVVALELPQRIVGPDIGIIGRVYDSTNNIESYSYSYGAGENPATWKLIGTGTTPVGSASVSGTIGHWNTTGLTGQYTLKLEAVQKPPYSRTSTVTQTVTVTNSAQLSGTLPMGVWTMVALPGRPMEADPKTFIGDQGRYEVQQWDPRAESDPYLQKYKINNIILNNAGQGFWVKPYEKDIQYSVDGYVTDTSEPVSISLYSGWNQIGSPYITRGSYTDAFRWSQVKVRINGGTTQEQVKTLLDAKNAGWIDGQFYGYSNNNYTAYGLDDALTPYTGYFVKALVDCDLLFDPSAGIPGGLARIVRPRQEWKLQLAASSGELRDTDNFAESVEGASDDFDPSDSGEPPTVKPFVSLYFDSYDAAKNPDRFSRDARAPGAVRQTRTWNFTVEVSDPGKPVTIYVADAESLPANYRFRIRDDESGMEFDPKQQAEYTYSSAATGRRFSLSATKLDSLAVETVSKKLPRGWSLFSAPIEPDPTDVRDQLAGILDNPQVFQYFDRALYAPDSSEHVDIQAGLAYWIYLENETELTFSGRKIANGAPVEIPLKQGWNLIGDPYESSDVTLQDIKVSRNGETVLAEEALARNWISRDMYEYNRDTGEYDSLVIGEPIVPWKGYVVRAIEECILIMEKKQN
ncbi:MAG TPA: hypothetical protein PLQ76_00030 [bacterium]|nr:hypothetical protein [bacterium]